MKNKFIRWSTAIIIGVCSFIVFDALFTPKDKSTALQIIKQRFSTKEQVETGEYNVGQLVIMKVDKKICQILKNLQRPPFDYLVRCPNNNTAYNAMWVSDFEIEGEYK